MKNFKILMASMIGSIIEWYDFYLYGTATSLVFATLYFPSGNPTVSLLVAFATFGAGYAARPIGSILFGHFGDKIGRKASLMLTLMGMGGSSFLIGLLPTYAQIGIIAPALLVFLRLVQGLALGGEWGGAVLLATESAKKGVRGLFGSIPQLGVPIGLIIGTFSFTFIGSITTNEAFMSWGWRIPFLFSAVLIALGLWIRNGVDETPEFKERQEKGDIEKFPVATLFKHHTKDVFRIIGLKLGDGLFNVFSMSFILTYATVYLNYTREEALYGVLIGCVAMMFTIPIVGYLSDYIGRKTIYIIGVTILLLGVYPYFYAVDHGGTIFYVAQIVLLGVVWGMVFATQGTFFSELFPANIRYTGLSLSYQIAAAIAGFGPMMWTALGSKYGASPIAFGTFMAIGLVISLLMTIFAAPDTRKQSHYSDIQERDEEEKTLQTVQS
ncbi:MFS transporter [Kurthia massiliensis]|uniref:MFS transporter n=1 Tax=Kurthia massiliensis TaxID=1033739 RepID=UPI00028A2A80|nr:MFS transporter [Kurthia massiliensis]